MPSVVCPTCGEKGKIPNQFIGIRIKCKKCGNSFLVTPPVAKVPVAVAAEAALGAPSPTEPKFDGIALDDLGPDAWTVASAAPVEASAEHDHAHDHEPAHDDSNPAFVATQGADAPAVKHYKILTQKDKFFDGKFDLTLLEQALNHYARQGWIVRSMATPHIAGFSGGAREELVILLER
jgi:hypothetical protein